MKFLSTLINNGPHDPEYKLEDMKQAINKEYPQLHGIGKETIRENLTKNRIYTYKGINWRKV